MNIAEEPPRCRSGICRSDHTLQVRGSPDNCVQREGSSQPAQISIRRAHDRHADVTCEEFDDYPKVGR